MNLIFGSCLEEAEKMRQVEFLSLWCFGGGPYGEGCPGGPRGGPGRPREGPGRPREGPEKELNLDLIPSWTSWMAHKKN